MKTALNNFLLLCGVLSAAVGIAAVLPLILYFSYPVALSHITFFPQITVGGRYIGVLTIASVSASGGVVLLLLSNYVLTVGTEQADSD
ncbi:MAG: hypothetical protein JWN70_5135 [Planctomycetaceae bacterium]|nr:hypothetical protein [Planctomycetaceae bacterium]